MSRDVMNRFIGLRFLLERAKLSLYRDEMYIISSFSLLSYFVFCCGVVNDRIDFSKYDLSSIISNLLYYGIC